jgi:hypothetical protein
LTLKHKEGHKHEGRMRPFIVWLIVCIWLATLLAVLIAARVRPSAIISASLNTKEVSLLTNVTKILGPLDEDQLLVSGIAKVTVQGHAMQTAFDIGSPEVRDQIQFTGLSSATCTFYSVRSTGITLTKQPSQITLWKPNLKDQTAFAVKSHGPLSGSLTGQSSTTGALSGLSCRRVALESGTARKIDVIFQSSGSSVDFSTAPDTQLDFRLKQPSEVEDTQIRIMNTLRFSHVASGPDPLEKTVLLAPPKGGKNEVKFEGLDHSVDVAAADLLVIQPQSEFFLKQFSAEDGIELNFHGDVKDVSLGAGPADLRSVMPSLFDHLSAQKRVYGVVPGIVALILGILERLKILPRESGRNSSDGKDK